ncbi:hypothetical protein M409DRAFT_18440 [Zasmidium cellare ATCC 36951]|uniref:Quinate transporter n=1 Tax=Zasmidium cellare ATCC 36951 TaxID=1080233 RepID=A0A6A6CWC4_ZASCE|nr:uncharacterized protein M409DRAFT_18440 [Zasmidium cellare ATCC 36951]KAF2171325.1 hypothetical protein M409DRAFT_18440 [Zasmidium cellare ATCC 36951]
MAPARHGPAITMAVPAPMEIFNFRVYAISLVASMGAFIFGYDLAFIGTTITLKPFQRDFGLVGASEGREDSFAANIVSLLQAGCFFGALAAAPLGDKLGRRPALMIAGVVFCIGSLMQTVSHGLESVMFVGRAIGGLGVGAASGLVPLYVAELAPPSIRGRLVGLYEISVQTGTCIGFWICYGVSQNMPANASQWITPFAVQLIPGGLLIIGMFFVPESPRWLARTHSREVAVAGLAKLRNLPEDHPYLQEEITHVVDQIEEGRRLEPGHGFKSQFKEMSRRGHRNRIAIGVVMFIFMQMAGSNAINYYSPRIFKSIGLTGSTTGLYATGIYGIVRLVAVVIAMYFVVDKVGRTKMLIGGSIVMGFAMWFIGAYVKLAPTTSSSTQHLSAGGYAAAVFIYIFAVGFCFSYAGIPWIYCAEIFPLRIRGIGMAICTATHWLMNFVIARSVPYMISDIGYGTYFVFASFITLSIPFVYFFVQETKGLSLEEMDILFGVGVGGGVDGMGGLDVEKSAVDGVVAHIEMKSDTS